MHQYKSALQEINSPNMFKSVEKMDVDEDDIEINGNNGISNTSLKKNETDWINTVLKKGTLNDKLAAHTLLIHESRNWSSLDALVEMVNPKKCRRQCVMAMNTLKELFLESLNISKRNSNITSKEDIQKVKFYYAKFIDHLHLVAFDNLEETRKKAIWVLSCLLLHNGYNNEYIIEKLVNKIGDKSPQVASTSAKLIISAINNKKQDLRQKSVNCIAKLLRNPNTKQKTVFYSIELLSRIKLIRGQADTANQMINIYLDLFKKSTDDKTFNSKLMTTLFVALHRAYPYSNLKNDVFEQHLQTLYTIVHNVNLKESIAALVFIKKIVAKRAQMLRSPIEDRYYNVIYKLLIKRELIRCSRSQQFCDLLESVLNEDPCLERKTAFVKRMLQVACYGNNVLAKQLLTTITKIKGYETLFVMDDEEDNKKKSYNNDKQGPNCNGIESDSDDDDIDDSNTNIASWVHTKSNKFRGDFYDPLARNPRYANAKRSVFNELYLLKSHYDNTIVDLVQQIMNKS